MAINRASVGLSEARLDVSPEELRSLGETEAFNQLFMQHLVEAGPMEAREHIGAICGSVPDYLGRGCAAFSLLQEFACKVLSESGLTNAVLLTAPHSHWGPVPIIYRWMVKDEVYRVGPLSCFADVANLIPVSFVFTPRGLQAHEWLEVPHDFETEVYRDVIAKLVELNNLSHTRSELQRARTCFGVCVNFRFKKLREPAIFPTLETPGADTSVATLSIDREPELEDLDQTGQIAWSLKKADVVKQNVFEASNFLVRNFLNEPAWKARLLYSELLTELDQS